MENHHFQWVYPLYMAIFNSYVKLPEGTWVLQDYKGGRDLPSLQKFAQDSLLLCVEKNLGHRSRNSWVHPAISGYIIRISSSQCCKHTCVTLTFAGGFISLSTAMEGSEPYLRPWPVGLVRQQTQASSAGRRRAEIVQWPCDRLHLHLLGSISISFQPPACLRTCKKFSFVSFPASYLVLQEWTPKYS